MGKLGVRIFAFGGVALGVIGLTVGDFALQWQPVPKEIPGRTVLAYICAAAMVLAGSLVFVRRTATYGVAGLAILYIAWVLLLHVPRVVEHPTNIGAWNGVAELSALAAAGLMAFSATMTDASRAGGLALAARLLFGLCPLVFGLAHFAYADFTASMVPAWIPPGQLFWAYFTGTAHAAAGLSILSGVHARLGARLLSVMFTGFVILLHIPRVYVDPSSRLEWTMLAIAISLTGAAWTMADFIGKRR